MKEYRYRVTVECLADAMGNNPDLSPIQFDFADHDNLFAIAERIAAKKGFTPESARAFGVGLKLFTSVVRQNKDIPLFAALMPHIGEIMKNVKNT